MHPIERRPVLIRIDCTPLQIFRDAGIGTLALALDTWSRAVVGVWADPLKPAAADPSNQLGRRL
jgi:hypothetical protein